MAKDPAFLFYFRDFLVSTELMTSEEVGDYIRLLCHQADKGHLTLKHMQSICKAYGIAHVLHNKFKIDKNGHYYNVRLEEEVVKRCNYTQSRRDNAKHMHEYMGNANANNKERIVKENQKEKTIKQSPVQKAYQMFLDKYMAQENKPYIPVWGKHCKLLTPLVKAIGQAEYETCLNNYFLSAKGRDCKYSFDFFIASINTWRDIGN